MASYWDPYTSGHHQRYAALILSQSDFSRLACSGDGPRWKVAWRLSLAIRRQNVAKLLVGFLDVRLLVYLVLLVPAGTRLGFLDVGLRSVASPILAHEGSRGRDIVAAAIRLLTKLRGWRLLTLLPPHIQHPGVHSVGDPRNEVTVVASPSPEGPGQVGLIGTLSARRGVLEACQAWRSLDEQGLLPAGARFLLRGPLPSGADRQRIEEALYRLERECPDSVAVEIGWVSDAEYVAGLGTSQVVLTCYHSHLSSSGALASLPANWRGCVISSDTGLLSVMVAEAGGIRVPVDSSSLADAILLGLSGRMETDVHLLRRWYVAPERWPRRLLEALL